MLERIPLASEDASLTGIPFAAGTITPHADNKRENTKRKQTLLSLLDALNELTKDDDFNRDITLDPRFEDDRDVPTVDEHLQKVGAESFAKFERGIINLDKQLRNFAHAARQLGSSVGILSSAYLLRERLAQILHLFHENAADLFPRKISHQDPTAHGVDNLPWRQNRRARMKAPPNVRTPIVLESMDPEGFPDQIDKFAEDITIFLECLNEFPEFTDEAVNASIMAFQGDLKYWASCLNQYRGQFRYPAVQRYLHDLSSELGEHIDSITSSLSLFIEVGVPTIRFAQKHGAANLLNLSTVATFFSAVTATTLQFSYADTHNAAANAVNAFWFTSLVFSIAAAVNSLLGLTWKQAMYRSPRHLVPWWVSMWIRRSPLMFLVLSVACFSAGLVVFTYSSGQNSVTSTITTVFSAFSSFGLAAVSAWFASERYVFNRHKGKKWLADVLDDASEQLVSIPGVRWMTAVAPAKSKDAIIWSGKTLHQGLTKIAQVGSLTVDRFANHSHSFMNRPDATATLEEGGIPNTHSLELPSTGTTFVETARPSRSDADRPPDSPIITVQGTDEPASQPKTRFAHLVRNMIMIRRTAAFGLPPKAEMNHSLGAEAPPRLNTEQAVTPRSSRVSGLVPKLRNMVPTQDIAAHSALVRHIQFSPDGRFLATSSWDRTSVIFRVGEPFTSHRVLLHPSGFVGQVAWSPSGDMIMTKLPRAVKIWTQDGVCRKTIERPCHVQSVVWLPGGEAFLSVEDSNIVRLDVSGKVMDLYHFDRMQLHDVAVTSDCQRIFTVGTMVRSADGLQPSKSRNEKQIIAFNLNRKEIENRVPVLHEVRDITISHNDQAVLVSYENKAPPQLWKVEIVKKTYDTASQVARLNLRHTYMPKVSVDFAGPSYFGGKDHQLILCAGKAGDVHIWDRESGALLHHIRAQIVGGDLTSVAWNHAADPFMFATASHDGAVRIWTSHSASQQASPYPEVLVSTPTTTEARTRSPSPYPPDHRFAYPPSPDPRSPSPGTYPHNPDYRTEGSSSFMRPELGAELRDTLADLDIHHHPRVSFQT